MLRFGAGEIKVEGDDGSILSLLARYKSRI